MDIFDLANKHFYDKCLLWWAFKWVSDNMEDTMN